VDHNHICDALAFRLPPEVLNGDLKQTEEVTMKNKHQIKGAVNEAAGHLQKNVGKATSNGSQTIKGAARELAGKAQKAYGDAKEDAGKDSKPDRDAREIRDRDIERHAG
jgi:uncharacterized protein YjbJ (UPF0337 family)